MGLNCFHTFHLMILISCKEKLMQIVHAIIVLKSRMIPLTFRSCKSWFNFSATFLNFYCFWHHVVFINSNKCFSSWFVAIFCNYSRVLSMHHSDSDADSKLFYRKTACKRDFMFFMLSVGDFGTLVKISCKYLIYTWFVIMNRTAIFDFHEILIVLFLSKNLVKIVFKFASFLWFLLKIVITQNTVELCEYQRKHQIIKKCSSPLAVCINYNYTGSSP